MARRHGRLISDRAAALRDYVGKLTVPCTTMKAGDVTDTLELALQGETVTRAPVFDWRELQHMAVVVRRNSRIQPPLTLLKTDCELRQLNSPR